jgi:hypothetical protein
MVEEEEKLINPFPKSVQEATIAKENEEKKKEEYIEFKKRASMEAKQRYEHLQNKVGKTEALIDINSNCLINTYS